MFKKQLLALVSSIPARLFTAIFLLAEAAYLGLLLDRFLEEYKPGGFEERIVAAAVMFVSSVSIVGMFFAALVIAVYALSLLQESNKTTLDEVLMVPK